jgi:hypothetical protein
VSDKVRELTSEGTGGKEVSDIVDQILDTEPAPKADNKPAGGDGLAPR